MRSKYVFIYV